MLRRFAITIGYLLAACLVVGLTIGLVAYGQGYSYNFSQHRVVRTGIVIIQSTPGSVKVSLDGKKPKKKTTYRQSFEAGSYTFTLAKDGYQTWTKTLKVLAGEVTLAQYVTLIPTDLRPQVVLATDPVTSQSLSHDHRHLAFVTSGAASAVYTSDFSSSKPTKVYTPAAATPTTPAESLVSVTWSADASHLLVMSQVGGAITARVMAADGSGAVNLTDQYRFDFTSLRFSGNDWKQLYWISPDGLRRLDLNSQSVSAVLADQVMQFQVEDDRLLYVQSTALGQSLWSFDYRSHKQQLIAALVPSAHYGLAYTTYRGTSELAVVPAGTATGTLYSDILGDNPVAQTIAHNVSDVSFSPDGHLVVFSGPASVTTYDLDQSNVFGSPVSYTFTPGALSLPPTWFDNFHLLLNENGQLVWREFDGQNAANFGPVQSSLTAFASADAKSVYVYRPATGTAQQLVNLTVKP